MQVLLEAARTTGYYVPGPFLAIAIARVIWSRTTITRPDGGKWTRGERDAWLRQQRRHNIALRKQWERDRRAARRR